MKAISLLLVFLLLLQSCSVYNRAPTSVEAAVASEKRVKIITTDNKRLKFKQLEKRDNKLIGITGRGSITSKKVLGMPAQIDGKYLIVDLSNLDIEQVRLRNKTNSTIATIGFIVGSLLVAFFALFAISFSQADLWSTETNTE